MQMFQVEGVSGSCRMVFGPDGRYLSLDSDPHTLLDTAGGPAKSFNQRNPPDSTYEWGHCFALGGRALAYIANLELIVEYIRREMNSVEPEAFTPRRLAPGPGGKSLFVIGWPEGKGTKSEIRQYTLPKLTLKARFGWRRGHCSGGFEASADGNWLAEADLDTAKGKIRIWDVSGKEPPEEPVSVIAPGVKFAGFALSADGSRLAVVGPGGLSVWDPATGKRVASAAKDGKLTAVTCDPTRPVIATGDAAGRVQLRDHAGKVLASYDWELKVVRALAFAADGLRCAALDKTGKVVVWDVDV